MNVSSADIEDSYSELVRGRDRRLSLAVKDILRDIIIADVSDFGVDLAVGKIFLGYKPGMQKWKPLRYSNTRWLVCKTKTELDQPLQTVHINLVNGELRVAGQPLGRLPHQISASPEARRIFRDVRLYFDFRR